MLAVAHLMLAFRVLDTKVRKLDANFVEARDLARHWRHFLFTMTWHFLWLGELSGSSRYRHVFLFQQDRRPWLLLEHKNLMPSLIGVCAENVRSTPTEFSLIFALGHTRGRSMFARSLSGRRYKQCVCTRPPCVYSGCDRRNKTQLDDRCEKCLLLAAPGEGHARRAITYSYREQFFLGKQSFRNAVVTAWKWCLSSSSCTSDLDLIKGAAP